MAKKLKPKPPITDGWIELSPGQKLHMTPELMESHNAQVKKIQPVRGEIVTGAIQIELVLDMFLKTIFYPDSFLMGSRTDDQKKKINELSGLFLYEVIKGRMNFYTKVELLGKISHDHFLLASRKEKVSVLLKNLDKIRRIRNIFAHGSMTYVPHGKLGRQNLRPEIHGEGKRIAITDSYLKEVVKVMNETYGQIIALHTEISK